MDAFSEAIARWHDFYLMVGTASATLIGLLFLSLSLNVGSITGRAGADLRALAAQTFGSFIFVLMFAVVFLIPDQVPMGLGLPLLAISAYGVYTTVAHWLATRRKPARAWRFGRSLVRRFYLPSLCFAVLIVIAVSVLLGRTSGLYWLVPVMIILMVGATRNAWDLLMALGKQARED